MKKIVSVVGSLVFAAVITSTAYAGGIMNSGGSLGDGYQVGQTHQGAHRQGVPTPRGGHQGGQTGGHHMGR